MLGFDLEAISVLIASGTSLSAKVNLGVKTVVGIAMPAAWDAADLTFQASADDGASFGEVQDGATPLVQTVSAGTVVQIDPAGWRGLNCLKVRSGASGAPVNQSADRTIKLLCRSVF